MIHSIASRALIFASAFEAEVLVELLFEKWRHPFSTDKNFKNDLLENATAVLEASVRGEKLIEELEPADVNLIAALWYVESTSLQNEPAASAAERDARKAWLDGIRRGLPSCFCDPNDLCG